MALGDVFLSPPWLAAAVVAVPVILLYLVRPEPERIELPTYRFLTEERRQRTTTPVIERLARSLLLVLQLLVILLVVASLAGPYVAVAQRTVVEETVMVVDTSASMSTRADGATRFDRAIAAAREEITETTSVVTTTGEIVLRRGTPASARRTLDRLTVTDSPGDLRSAIAQARSLATEDVRVVVLSDFAGDAWTDPVSAARARGLTVELRQFDRGGGDNVGFVDRRFSGTETILTVKNFGDDPVDRTVALGDQQVSVDLGPGDVRTVTFSVPAGGGRATLSPGDGFPADDTVFVAAPRDPTVDVLVLTNDRNRFLVTALDVADQVSVTVDRPPTTIERKYDVIVYSNVDSDSLLPGNVQAGRDVLENGGGVAIQAQPEMPDYGELSIVESAGIGTTPTIRRTVESELTRDIDFQPPSGYLVGSLREGRSLVTLRDGSPLVATARRGSGRVLYYGYIESRSSFKYNFQYPVFWRRAAFYLAGRESLAELNHETGETAQFDSERVDGPSGTVAGPTVTLQRAGFYTTGNSRKSASLLDESESRIEVDPLSERGGTTGNLTQVRQQTVPRRLTEVVALGALLLLLVEIAYLRRRGDL